MSAVDFDVRREISLAPVQERAAPGPRIEVLPSASLEEGFSSKKYFTLALVVAALAIVALPLCFPAAISLFATSAWYLWSAAVILLNRTAEGTRCERVMHRLYALTMEVNAVVASAILFPYTLFSCYHSAKGKKDGRPILMVNGYLGFGSNWDYQREKLIEAGLGPVYTMNVGSLRSIKTYAKEVQAKVAEIQKETGRKDLALVGHSKGGLVSSYYATKLADKETTITDVITIGSPLGGTPVAYIGPGYDASEMRPDTPFNQKLRQKIKENRHIRFSHIASEQDDVVPLSSALPEGDRSRKLVLKDIGHVALVYSSRVADQTCKWLKESENKS